MQTQSNQVGMEIPAHVPQALVHPFDYYNMPEQKREPHKMIREWVKSRPPIFYTPHNRGHWVVTRSADALDMLRQTENFSSAPEYNWAMRNPRTYPHQVDPPYLMEYRRIRSPFFPPAAMKLSEPRIRAQARAWIE